ncbi:MAG: hypothetical protein SVW57_13685, partial [Thermodesulfobacteriota bacterium]|nr:hypothetical protein [Thermodesulfobacteriota bacterium]
NLEHTYAMSAEQQYMTKITGTASGLPEAATVKEKPVNGDWVTALIDAMTQAVSESKVKPEKMTRVLPKFIDQLFEKHVIKDDPDRLKQDLVERIKPGFLQTLSEKGISDKLTDHDNGAELEASGGEISDENRDVQRECENEDVGEWENVKENEDVHINK